MNLPAKKRPEEKASSLNLSFWRRMEEEEEEEKKEEEEEEKEEEEAAQEQQLTLAREISSTLAECLQLADKGFLSEELLARLSRIPEVEKFAQFWICKARLLLARGGPFDAAGLCEAALRAGAVPLQELWDGMADMLKDTNKTPWAAPTPDSLLPGKAQTESSPQGQNQGPVCKPISAVKFQVIPLFRVDARGARPEVKLLTPVRRSLRIERAAACYPQMLKDHHPVVSSLEEIASADCESQFIFRHNDALLEEVGLTGLATGLGSHGQDRLPGAPRPWPS
nr:cytoskeleton-associated protein 2-like isoform X1 [Pogona vitticeps]